MTASGWVLTDVKKALLILQLLVVKTVTPLFLLLLLLPVRNGKVHVERHLNCFCVLRLCTRVVCRSLKRQTRLNINFTARPDWNNRSENKQTKNILKFYPSLPFSSGIRQTLRALVCPNIVQQRVLLSSHWSIIMASLSFSVCWRWLDGVTVIFFLKDLWCIRGVHTGPCTVYTRENEVTYMIWSLDSCEWVDVKRLQMCRWHQNKEKTPN